jgi:GR25 family glycosyltransferase involved in LPS biosynthesis
MMHRSFIRRCGHIHPSLSKWFRQVFVINLANRPERFASVTRQLTKSGIIDTNGFEVKRFEAIQGTQLNPAVLEARGFLSRLGAMRLAEPPQNKIWGMDLNAGGLGCAMSHMVLWAHIAASQPLQLNSSDARCRRQGVLIVEDDSIFPADGLFLEHFNRRMEHVPHDWNFVYVGGLDTARVADKLRVGDGVSRVPQLHRTTNCYLIHANGARQLLETVVPFTYQIDTQMTAETEMSPGGRGDGVPYAVAVDHYFTMQPPLVTQAGSEMFASDIQQA